MDFDESKFRKMCALKDQQHLLDLNKLVIFLVRQEYEDADYKVALEIKGDLVSECKLKTDDNGVLELFIKCGVLGNLRLTQSAISYGPPDPITLDVSTIARSVRWKIAIGWEAPAGASDRNYPINEVYNRIVNVIKHQVRVWAQNRMLQHESLGDAPSLVGKTCFIKL